MNKMDKVGADFLMCVNSMKERLGTNPVPIQWPLGEEDQHQGIVDLIKMKAAVFDEESKGQKFEWVEIPADLKEVRASGATSSSSRAPTSTTRSWRFTSTGTGEVTSR
jgi:translation elongation factor EF-G